MSMSDVATKFFEACETGKGWEGCTAYCHPNATFTADGRYELKAWGVDEPRKSVSAYGVFYATHTGQGGPCPPTGKKTKTDYVYVMQFEGDKIKHMQKIWHSGLAMKELGWA